MDNLFACNPWARRHVALLEQSTPDALDLLASSETVRTDGLTAFRNDRLAAHRERLGLPVQAWNNWAMAMASAGRGLLRAGRQQSLWRAFAQVDLAGQTFDTLDLGARVFPSGLSLAKVEVRDELFATGMQVADGFDASGAVLHGDCWIDQCRFDGPVLMDGIQLYGRIEARSGSYAGPLRARGARFERDCWFVGSTFAGAADFTGTTFRLDAGFGRTRWLHDARFDQVRFEDTLGMEECDFGAGASFNRAVFAGATFFDRTRFAREPVIDGATFDRAPRIVGAMFPEAAPDLLAAGRLRLVASRS